MRVATCIPFGNTCVLKPSEYTPLSMLRMVEIFHEAGLPPDAESMAFWTDELRRSDTLLYGRVTYELMEGAWRRPASGQWPDWMDASEVAFAAGLSLSTITAWAAE